MIKLLQSSNIILIAVSAMLSLKTFRLRWPPSLRIFSVLLWAMLFFELLNLAWKSGLHQSFNWHYNHSTGWIDNISILIQTSLYIYFYYKVFEKELISSQIKLALLLCLLSAFINWYFIQGATQFNTYTNVMMNFVLIWLALAYFKKAKKERTILQLNQQPLLWISIGSFICHSGSIPFLLTMLPLFAVSESLSLSFYYIYAIIQTFMNICYLLIV